MIQVESLHKKFGKNVVLAGLELNIDQGGIFAILGPNGSGKTTLIKTVLGMVIPNKGTITVMDSTVRNSWEYRQDINYLPQIANFPGNLKVKELIAMIKDIRQKPSDEQKLIAQFGLEPFLDKKLSNLSGGPLIILDEPTNGLDPLSLIRLKELIFEEKAKGKTFLITSHIMQFVEEVSDQIVYLLEGKIYFKGSIAELKTKTGQSNFEHAIAAISTHNNHD